MKQSRENAINLSPQHGASLVVMAGGSGTRFWPLSRSAQPKQYLPLGGGGQVLIEEVVGRFANIVGEQASLVISSQSQLELLQRHVPHVPVLAEPEPRNTAPCLALAAHFLLKTVGDIPMICVPADHVIHGQEALETVFRKAVALAESDDVLITIGVNPTFPETGYGYLKRGSAFNSQSGKSTGGFQVAQFVEKPDLKTAERYVESGDFFWNSGMFVWRPSVFIEALTKFLPEVSSTCQQYVELFLRDVEKGTEEEKQRKLSELYHTLDSVSVDVGVMENASNTVMFPAYGFSWSDVGSWASWADTARDDFGDSHENVVVGDALMLNSRNCVVVDATEWSGALTSKIKSEAGKGKFPKSIAVVGLDDVIIVEAGDSLLVCKKGAAQQVKQVVDILKKRGREDLI